MIASFRPFALVRALLQTLLATAALTVAVLHPLTALCWGALGFLAVLTAARRVVPPWSWFAQAYAMWRWRVPLPRSVAAALAPLLVAGTFREGHAAAIAECDVSLRLDLAIVLVNKLHQQAEAPVPLPDAPIWAAYLAQHQALERTAAQLRLQALQARRAALGFGRFHDRSTTDSCLAPELAAALATLGLPALPATLDEVRRAWRRMAQQWHPDRFAEADVHDQAVAQDRAVAANLAFAALERHYQGLALAA